MSKPSRVLTKPLAIIDDRGHFVSSAIRDPETEEIVDTAVTSYALAEKAGIPLAQAQRIFWAAQNLIHVQKVAFGDE